MMKSKMKRLNALSYIAALVLLAATLATTAGTYAAYRSSATGTATAQVAKWDVQLVTTDGGNKEFAGNMDDTNTETLPGYTFSVTSGSEVAVKYDLVVSFSAALDGSITPTIDGIAGEPNADRTSFTFTSGDWEFSPAGGTRAHTLTLTRVYFQNNQFPATFTDVGVEISVIAEQID